MDNHLPHTDTQLIPDMHAHLRDEHGVTAEQLYEAQSFRAMHTELHARHDLNSPTTPEQTTDDSLTVLGALLVRLLGAERDGIGVDVVSVDRPMRAEGVVMQLPKLTFECYNVELTMREWDVVAPVLGLRP